MTSASLPRRGALRAALGLGAALVLPRAGAHELITSTLRVTHPWTRATAPGASFAVLCMRFDEVSRGDRLIRVESPLAAGADMGGVGAGPAVDFAIPEGVETYLSEAGTYVRLIGLSAPLEVGRSYPLVLGFEHGGVYNTSVSVDFTRFD